jgi:RNA ligase
MTFKAYPKVPRLFRPVTITEKIDGTNAQITFANWPSNDPPILAFHPGDGEGGPGDWIGVYAGSRTRLVYPGKSTDNYGFAAWVRDNYLTLFTDLGIGRHYGEWYGQGINRGYGLDHKRFAVFVQPPERTYTTPNVHSVPVLYQGDLDPAIVDIELDDLRVFGSRAVPGYMDPEGVMVWHHASSQMFKVTCKDDQLPKGIA